jgi:hypothetical protein
MIRKSIGFPCGEYEVENRCESWCQNFLFGVCLCVCVIPMQAAS